MNNELTYIESILCNVFDNNIAIKNDINLIENYLCIMHERCFIFIATNNGKLFSWSSRNFIIIILIIILELIIIKIQIQIKLL